MRWSTRERPRPEMCEKSRAARDKFFSMVPQNRPKSVHTEFMETDWEMETESELYSEIEDLEGVEDGDSSPRISVGSVSFPPECALRLTQQCCSLHYSPDNPA